jgi:hypothetical protein
VDGVVGWLVTAAGVVVVLLALRDIFHTLWHPSGRSGVSRPLLAAVWRAGRLRRSGRRVNSLAGPLTMVVVALVWVGLIVFGWTLIYWPHLTEGFAVGPALRSGTRGGLLDALYLSMVTIATLGFGDIVPTEEWLRVAVPLQALLGFVLLTAAVTWVLQIYPALTRRRALSIRLSLLERADAARIIDEEDVALAAPLLESLANDLVQARVDLTHYAEIYYFRDGERDASLAATLPTAAALAQVTSTSSRADLRFAGLLLAAAVSDLARLIDAQYLRVGGTLTEILHAYAADHGYAGTPPQTRG